MKESCKHRFYLLSRYRYKLTYHWINFYLDNLPNESNRRDPRWNKQYKFGIDEYITALIMASFAMRGIYASLVESYTQNFQLQVYLGSFFKIIDAHPFHIEVLCFIWATNFLTTQVIALFCKREHFNWLKLILFLEDQLSGQCLALNTKESVSVKRLGRIIFFVVHSGIINISIGTIMLMLIIFYFNFTLVDYLTFGIFWAFFHAYLSVNITGVIYMTNAYLFLISYILRLKIQRFECLLQAVLNRRFNSVSKCTRLVGTYRFLNHLMRTNDEYNVFWKHVFTISLLWRLLIINFIAFVVFFYKINTAVWILYQMMFFNENLAFFSLVIHVTSLHGDMRRCGKLLQNYLISRKHKILSSTIKTINFMNFLQDSHNFGHRVSTGTIIQRFHIIAVVREFSLFFILLANLSLQFKLH